MTNKTRQLELSKMFRQMGESLLDEGKNSECFEIAQSGTLMLLLSTLVSDTEDMFIFSELVAMFSAKKILDAIDGNDSIENKEKEIINAIIQKRKSSTTKKTTRKRKPKDTE